MNKFNYFHTGESLYEFSAEVVECNNQTLTVKNLPFWCTIVPNKYSIDNVNATIIDAMITPEIGILYLNKPVNLRIGTYIKIKSK